ncbi:molecular chaperone HscB [Marchantia polymorpha subsp. ruderalis]|uniref:J domain-containing protein n=1 Tax=Marchantia polymorpha TaxID=3197 RepID=A0A2R6WV78_MARPO|nr:hypothetical protein MARPO_0055s0040 [Marchantia polymorpha]BBN03027.1 hypothetical protein Mp_2g20090 [Marchantia polymorpha subsp. ruderalis]|eukprot:PTQ37761.1 hypothetical protein MARPO_0055s0040 [Marchantia polymorpha]
MRRQVSSSGLYRHFLTRNLENGAEKSVRALNSSAQFSSTSRFPDSPGAPQIAHPDRNSGTSQGLLSFFQPVRCLDSSARPRHVDSVPRSSVIETRRRSFVATAGNEKGPSKKCWACEHDILGGSGLFCPSCDGIQPLDLSVDHFTIFGIERSFKVDSKELEQRYKSLQKKLHPDLMSSKSQKEQGYSADQSSHVIQAYFQLLKPLSRARYLLGLHGIKVDEEGTIDDPALLMEIMEIRESLEDVSDAKELQKLQAQNALRIQDTEKVLEKTFAAGDLKKAVSWVQRLAYYNKVDEEIVRKL